MHHTLIGFMIVILIASSSFAFVHLPENYVAASSTNYVSYVTDSAPNSSQWLIIESTTSPYAVTTNNTGTVPQYSDLSSLNNTKIGIFCTAINATYDTCSQWTTYQQPGWYWDSIHTLLYIHYMGDDPIEIDVYYPTTTSNGGTGGQGGQASIAPPAIVASAVHATSRGGEYNSQVNVENTGSDLEATITSLNFSSSQASFDSADLPLAVAPFATESINVTVAVPAGLANGTSYSIAGSAQVVEGGSNLGITSEYVVNFNIQVFIGGQPNSLNLIWLYVGIVVAIVASAAFLIKKVRDD